MKRCTRGFDAAKLNVIYDKWYELFFFVDPPELSCSPIADF